MITVGILTISDKGSRGERRDDSGPAIREVLAGINGQVVSYEIVPDEADMIAGRLAAWADSGRVDLVLTTGGTGLGPRDVTPEATLSVVNRVVPGLAETMRARTFDASPFSILSRAVAGARGMCLIVNLPGSPKAVREWITKKGKITEDEFVETIPYEETRNYVIRVLSSARVYRMLYGFSSPTQGKN